MRTTAATVDLPWAAATSHLLTGKAEIPLNQQASALKVIFRLQHQGNEERVFLLWVMVKN